MPVQAINIKTDDVLSVFISFELGWMPSLYIGHDNTRRAGYHTNLMSVSGYHASLDHSYIPFERRRLPCAYMRALRAYLRNGYDGPIVELDGAGLRHTVPAGPRHTTPRRREGNGVDLGPP